MGWQTQAAALGGALHHKLDVAPPCRCTARPGASTHLRHGAVAAQRARHEGGHHSQAAVLALEVDLHRRWVGMLGG